MTMQDDLANRSPDIPWPEGFEPGKADLFAHNQLVINARRERVWRHIVEATKWPQWYPNARDVGFVGEGPELKADSIFRWTTFGFPLESRVHEFKRYSRMGWFGYAPGAAPTFYHTWYLSPQDDGAACLVVTEEVGIGVDARNMRQADEGELHRGHDLWLATLKWVSEKGD